jgi:hypothetical protein
VRSFIAGLLGLLVPGSGHAYAGRRRAALVFILPVIVLVVAWVILFVLSGRTSLIGMERVIRS